MIVEYSNTIHLWFRFLLTLILYTLKCPFDFLILYLWESILILLWGRGKWVLFETVLLWTHHIAAGCFFKINTREDFIVNMFLQRSVFFHYFLQSSALKVLHLKELFQRALTTISLGEISRDIILLIVFRALVKIVILFISDCPNIKRLVLV